MLLRRNATHHLQNISKVANRTASTFPKPVLCATYKPMERPSYLPCQEPKTEVVVIGCGSPNLGMGWYHGEFEHFEVGNYFFYYLCRLFYLRVDLFVRVVFFNGILFRLDSHSWKDK